MCHLFNIKRDSYYKSIKRKAKVEEREAKVLDLARGIRQRQPMLGCRKILFHIKPKMEEIGCPMGRDKFFELLGENGMHIEIKRRYTRTTYSNHEYAVAPNRVKGLEVNKVNQVFVSDITYVSLARGYAYLFLVTDLYSRKIVGYELRKDLKHDGAITALERALLGIETASGIIHHSDRGCQYCCHDFLDYLKKHKVIPSMTDESHCYQNAVAERVNGILKIEYYIDSTFKNIEQARRAVENAIQIYNTERVHFSLGLKTPEEVYKAA